MSDDTDNDDNDETPPRKKSSRPEKIEALMDERRWDDVRKRLGRISSPKRIGELLYHSADNPDVPDDIFKILLDKLDGQREVYTKLDGQRIVYTGFWEGVCNYKRQRRHSKEFGHVCLKRSIVSLTYFLEDYADVVGKLPYETARDTISYLWGVYLTGHDPRGISAKHCLEGREDGLLRLSSIEDLQSNENLRCLWKKTELLVKLTTRNGLGKSVRELPLVHIMIRLQVPKVVVWFAVRLYPAQARWTDGMGRLPLHWDARHNNIDTERDFRVRFQGKLSKIMRGRLVETMLDFFPAGAKYPDAQGSLPLALLLDLEYRSWTTNDWTQRCVLALVQQAPEALSKRNAENHMLPFMTAASIHDDNTVRALTKGEEQRMLRRKLKLTYALLQADPSVLAVGIKETPQETFLRKRLEEAQCEKERLEEENRRLREEISVLEQEKDCPHDSKRRKTGPTDGGSCRRRKEQKY